MNEAVRCSGALAQQAEAQQEMNMRCVIRAGSEQAVDYTDPPVAIHDLGLRVEALELAVRELALEVQKFHDELPIDSGTKLRNE